MTVNEIAQEKLKEYERDFQDKRDIYERRKAVAERRLIEARNLYELEKRNIMSELGETKKQYYRARERLRTYKKYHTQKGDL